MTENVENLILEQLRKIRGVQDDHTAKLDQLLSRLNGVEKQVSRITREEASNYAEIIEDRHRLDAVVKRLERIERRLELED
jgi:tetrahydromethanopterin S-methyltransferase subunit G